MPVKEHPTPRNILPPRWLALLLLVAGACALKLTAVLQLQDHLLLQPAVGLDTAAYVELAQRVRAGDLGLGPGLYYVSPLYIYALAAGLALTDSFTAVRVIQVLLGTASVASIFFTARAWFGERAAWISAGLAVLTGLFTFYELLILQASVDTFLTSAGLLCLTMALGGSGQSSARDPKSAVRLVAGLKSRPTSEAGRPGLPPSREASADHRSLGGGGQTRRSVWLLFSGIVFGLQSLNRPNMLIAVGGVVGVMLVMRRFRPAALLVAGLVLGLAPVAIRNVVVAGQWTLVSSHGGLNFYIGNGEGATGFYRTVSGITPNIVGQQTDVRRVAAERLGRPVTDSEASDYFFDQAWAWMGAHPGQALALFAKKVGYTFHAQHIALPHSYPFYARDANTILRWLFVGPWLLVPLGLVGLVFAAPAARRQDYLVFASFAPSYAAAVALFFVAERYRLPLLVPLTIGAGAAVDLFIRTFASRGFPGMFAGSWVTFVALLILVNWPTNLYDGRWEERIRLAEQLIKAERYDEADVQASRLVQDSPMPAVAEQSVGLAYLGAGQPDRAIPHLRRAQELKPGESRYEYALGLALLQAGQTAAALPHLRQGFDSGVDVTGGGYDLAVALQTTGDLAGAADVIRRIRLGSEASHEEWLRLGRLAMAVKVPDAAEPLFKRAAEMRPDLASARQQYGLNLLVLNRLDEAARELAAAVQLDPRDADSLAHLAYCEVKLGRLAEARSHTDAALAIDPANPMAKQLGAAIGKNSP